MSSGPLMAGGTNIMAGGGHYPEIEAHKPQVAPGSTLANAVDKVQSFEATVDKKGWEQADFPIVCETCLGPNPFVRMMKEDHGRECKICQRPCTLFRWKPGSEARHKRNEICQTCARIKNCCQTCIFDLEYGLPVEVRDKYLAENERMIIPNSHVNRDFWMAEQQKKIEAGDLPYGKEKHPMLEKLARRLPYYKRNEARICTFFVKGTCSRGDECPYRHEMPETGELAMQNMRDRFHGRNDPLAAKLMRRAQNELTLSAPEDKTITTLYVGGVPVESGEQDVRDAFYQYGEIKIIKMLPKQRCSFVVFQHREAAELAAERCFKALKIGGKMVRIQWAEKADGGDTVAKKQALALMEKEDHSKKDPLAKQEAMAAYPSQNTWNQGNAPLQREEDAERLAAAAAADPLAPVGHDGKGYGSMAAGFTATNGARAAPYDNVADGNGKGKKGKGKKGKSQISGRGLAGAR